MWSAERVTRNTDYSNRLISIGHAFWNQTTLTSSKLVAIYWKLKFDPEKDNRDVEADKMLCISKFMSS